MRDARTRPRSIHNAAPQSLQRDNSTILFVKRSCLALKFEYAEARRIRERNKLGYRLAHWPIWICVYFLVPGPLVFDLLASGPNIAILSWFFVVLAGTGIAGLFAQLPGVEPRPYILRFCEDKPNPMYRRICYTFAWNALLNYSILNFAGLVIAVATGRWYLKQIYRDVYFPLLLAIVCLGALGVLPRAKASTRGEGVERRYFYGAVWACVIAQALLLLLWKALPTNHIVDLWRLTVYVLALVVIGSTASLGLLPRTRPILPGEVIVAD